MVKLAIDMMGGDNAPDIVLEAVQKAVEDFKDLEIILFGDEKSIIWTMNESNLDIVLKRLKWKMSLLERLNVKKIAQW